MAIQDKKDNQESKVKRRVKEFGSFFGPLVNVPILPITITVSATLVLSISSMIVSAAASAEAPELVEGSVVVGAKGEEGPQGGRGLEGPQGPTGVEGPRGEIGLQGASQGS